MEFKVALVTGAGSSRSWCGVCESVSQVAIGLKETPLVVTTGPHSVTESLTGRGICVESAPLDVDRLVGFRRSSLQAKAATLLAVVRYVRRVLATIRRYRVRCVYLSDSVPILLLALPLRMLGLRVAIGLRGTPGAGPLWSISYLACDVIVVLSEEMKSRALQGISGVLRARLARRMLVIPNTVAVPASFDSTSMRADCRRRLGIDDQDIALVYVAQFDRRKNQQWVISQVSPILGRNRVLNGRFHLMLVGGPKGPSEAAYYSDCIARSARVPEVRFHFLGPQRDVWPWYLAADIALLASTGEGQPRTVLEAMGAGLPVVSTSVISVQEMLAPPLCGIVVPINDVGAFSEAILRISQDPRERREMGLAAKQRCLALFNQRASMGAYQNLFDELLTPP